MHRVLCVKLCIRGDTAETEFACKFVSLVIFVLLYVELKGHSISAVAIVKSKHMALEHTDKGDLIIKVSTVQYSHGLDPLAAAVSRRRSGKP